MTRVEYVTIKVILFTLVGGMGSVLGPVVGTALLYPPGEWRRAGTAPIGPASTCTRSRSSEYRLEAGTTPLRPPWLRTGIHPVMW